MVTSMHIYTCICLHVYITHAFVAGEDEDCMEERTAGICHESLRKDTRENETTSMGGDTRETEMRAEERIGGNDQTEWRQVMSRTRGRMFW